MGYLITTADGGLITGLYSDEPGYATPPPGAVPISDADGELLRRGFGKHKLTGGVIVENAELMLVEAKAAKTREIEAARDAACFADISALGRAWQTDERSQTLLNAAITLAQAGAPLPDVWRDAANANMAVTALADLLAIAGAMAVQTQAAYSQSWARKAEIEAATTIGQVNAVIWV